ncbi:dienelactone hydrolase family protein [Fulvivirgaceae bacterium BMA10]|uniref:Dienelactone hydrolase family protein n=1 Tax=Splendidivirga corallicola TaxID=3051826 RepID=A0ABT8KXK4_9BACT|nr:dienelactone hydrolase family protein [Fulvivirgaceae bacterium BMA10]
MRFLLVLLILPLFAHFSTAQVSSKKSSKAIEALEEWLKSDWANRPDMVEEDFAKVALTREDAQRAKDLLIYDRKTFVKTTWSEEWDKRELAVGEYKMKFGYKTYGKKPLDGWSLYISMHGGGATSKEVNDRQWKNQIRLYQPHEGIYLAPRAPTDSWNMWHQAHVDSLLDRIIEACVVFLDVNPNKVYLTGYSAGGDGVYQLAPRMADRFAAAAMMAGHPNDASPINLRNIGFAIHMGGNDGAYQRNEVAQRWGLLLDSLQKADPDGYKHNTQIHEGKGHWMEGEDKVAIPWMAKFKRQPLPDVIIWKQDDVIHNRFYWLQLADDEISKDARVTAKLGLGEIKISKTNDINKLTLNLDDRIMDLNKRIFIYWNDQQVFKGKVRRNILAIWRTLQQRGDRELVFSSQLELSAPK